ncbi:8943_t:CDS:1, partial [Paraglomus brasilianum]
MFSNTTDFLVFVGTAIILYIITWCNSRNTEKRFDAKMTASLKKQQKIISGLSEAVKYLGYDIREVRDGVARSSNADL